MPFRETHVARDHVGQGCLAIQAGAFHRLVCSTTQNMIALHRAAQELRISLQRDPLQHAGAGVALRMERSRSEAIAYRTPASPGGQQSHVCFRFYGSFSDRKGGTAEGSVLYDASCVATILKPRVDYMR